MVDNVNNDVGSEPIMIRAHHLLCMQGFQGYGYNKSFTENMTYITGKLSKNPSTFLMIVIGPDFICKHCPHYSNGKCNMDLTSESRIRVMDDLLLQKIGFQEGNILSWSEVKSLTTNLSRKSINKICGGCFWGDKCLTFQERGL